MFSCCVIAGSIHQLARQVGVLLGPGLGLLFEVGAGAVAAFDDFVVVEGLVELLHLGGELCARGRGLRGRPWWW